MGVWYGQLQTRLRGIGIHRCIADLNSPRAEVESAGRWRHRMQRIVHSVWPRRFVFHTLAEIRER